MALETSVNTKSKRFQGRTIVPRRIAFRYLWSSRKEAAIWIISLFSILGVAIGVIVLNITMAVFSGFQSELRNKILGADAHIIIRSLSGRVSGYESTQKVVEAVKGVVSVSPFTQNQALIQVGDRSSGILIRGILPNTAAADQVASYLKKKETLSALFSPEKTIIYDDSGEPTEAELPALLVGHALMQQFSILPGTPVSLLSPEVSSSPFGLMPRFRRFQVIGSYKSGLIEYEQGLAYVSLKDAQQFFRLGDAISGLELRVDNIDEAPKIAERVLQALGGVSSGFIVQDWTATNRPFFEAMALEKRVYFIVLLLIIVMASFSIVSSLVMMVVEKRRDIAILRTLGATSGEIGKIFRIQGSMIGAIGVGFGILGGYIGCLLLRHYGFPIDERIFQMSTLPIRIEWENFAGTGAASFLICFLSTLYPARKASRMAPSEILRYG